jgi:hypothetical protein
MARLIYNVVKAPVGWQAALVAGLPVTERTKSDVERVI